MSVIAILFAAVVSATHGGDHICGPDPDFCGNNAVSEPIRSCTEGFFFSELENCCVRDVVYDPAFFCPNGGEVLPDGTCICESHPRIACPEGFTYDRMEDSCVHAELSPMIPSCAHRPDLAGSLSEDGRRCIYFKEMPPRYRCPKGAKMIDGQCISYELLPADDLILSCPDGWDLDPAKEQCVLVERVDCQKTKHKNKCKASQIDCIYEDFQACEECVFPDDHRKLCVGCKAKVKPEILCQAAACKMAVREPKLKERSFVEPVVCERVTVLPAKAQCVRGVYNHFKRTCCIETVHQAEQYCSGQNGSFSGGSCMKQLHYLSDYVCPAPYEVSCGSRQHVGKKMKGRAKEGKDYKFAHPSSCECVALSFAPPLPDCPIGWVFNPDVYRCVQTLVAEPYCPERDASLINGLCVRQEREPVRLEYTVTYVTEEPCILDQCIKEKVPIKKRKVTHKEVQMRGGKAVTKCHDMPCVDKFGAPVLEPVPAYGYVPPLLTGAQASAPAPVSEPVPAPVSEPVPAPVSEPVPAPVSENAPGPDPSSGLFFD